MAQFIESENLYIHSGNTVKALYFAVFLMNVSSLEFNFADFEIITLLQYTAKTFAWYLTSWKQFVREIRKINPT